MLANPEMLRQMMNPTAMQNAMSMMQGGGMGGMGGMPPGRRGAMGGMPGAAGGAAGGGGGGGGSASAGGAGGAAAGGMPAGGINPMIFGMPGAAAADTRPPKEKYAEQIS